MKTYYVVTIGIPHNYNQQAVETFTPAQLAKACCIDHQSFGDKLEFNYSRPRTDILSIYELRDDGHTKIIHHENGRLSLKDKISNELRELVPLKKSVTYAEGMK